jgi:transcriptional regulator with XRE-family HTH domain
MALKNIIGWQIRHIRIQKGQTVNQLSSALPSSSPLSSEEIARIELGTRKVFDHEIQALSQALKVSVEDLYATSPSHPPDDNEVWETLAQLEDIISGIEAQADNLGIDLEEARHWWQKARRLIDRGSLAGSKPAEGAVSGRISTPQKKVKKAPNRPYSNSH